MPLTPSIPLFRSRRFNPGFSTQFGALHGGLYAPARLTRHIHYTQRTCAHTHTHTRDTHILFSSSSSFPRILLYPPHTHTPTHRVTRPYPGSPSRLLFPPYPPSFPRERRPLHAALPSFSPPSLSRPPLPSFTLAVSRTRLSLAHSPGPLNVSRFSLYPVSVSIYPSFSLPLSHRL